MKDNRREQILEYVKREFIGPDPIDVPGFTQSNGEEILMYDSPKTRYIAGILYPGKVTDTIVEAESDAPVEILSEDSDDNSSAHQNDQNAGRVYTSTKLSEDDDADEIDDEVIDRSNSYRPSAFSITVALDPLDSVKAAVNAAVYLKDAYLDEKGKKRFRYLRKPICWKTEGFLPLPGYNNRTRIFSAPGDDKLKLVITYRYHQNDYAIYTFSLVNTKISSETNFKDEDCYFQAGFTVFSILGFRCLPENNYIGEDEDRESNLLLYRNVHTYAIGHGISADWEDSDKVTWVSTAVFPTYEIKPVVPNALPDINLSMYEMSDHGNFHKGVESLNKLCDAYEKWISDTEKRKASLDKKYQNIASKHIEACRKCLLRMRSGIKALQTNDMIRQAFQLANRAMLMQQLHYHLPLQRWDDNAESLITPIIRMPDVDDPSTWYGSDKYTYNKWRPFQIAFILMNLNAMYDDYSPDRKMVDLIWFPTGGGKTEAYLGLSAYTIFLRRLKDKSDSGTAILMRYTLRLLTAQQYQRASGLICCCEMIRRENPAVLGPAPISIGLWVGGDNTPNKMSKAVDEYRKLYDNPRLDNPFVVLKCPWCGAEMRFTNNTNNRSPGYKLITRGRGKTSVIFQCGNTEHGCAFSDRRNCLPMYIVDESIYENTPTMIIGTVDKFATLPSKPEARSIFGIDKNGRKVNAPSLIIQDELHLISGPLGSMVGIYETLIHELCVRRGIKGDYYPKIIASTATISHAKEQCQELYGCSSDEVIQFPPAGIDAGDSFFAKEDNSPEKNGRLYVGIMADGASSDAMASIYLYSSLLYAAKAIDVNGDETKRDPYWTIIGYYNSIRELGTAETWIHDDIEHHLDSMYRRRKFREKFATQEEYRKSRRYIGRSEELTSRIQSSKVSESLSHLEISYPDRSGEYPIDICMATNMISVGLDVQRLGLMVVTGQPKTTSEYIQATSRVGRDAGNAPGIVFVNYVPSKPRDKSHYEQFRSYHSRIYCNVEPTSVTPFAAPVRKRALPAILFSMIRLEGDKEEVQNPNIPDDQVLNHVRNVIKERVLAVEKRELDETMNQITKILTDWENMEPSIWYAVPDEYSGYKDVQPLMYGAGNIKNPKWMKSTFAVPNSMRNVDAECVAKQMANQYIPEEK